MIPQPVIDYDNTLPIVPSTFKVNSVIPSPQVSIAFGRTLQDLSNLEGWTLKSEHPVPRVVHQVIEHIRANGKLYIYKFVILFYSNLNFCKKRS